MTLAEREMEMRQQNQRPVRRWPCSRRVTDAMRRVAEEHGIALAEVLGPGKRSTRATSARRSIAKQLRAEGHSTPEIGRILGGIDPSAVHYMLYGKPSRPVVEIGIDEMVANDSGWWAV